MTRLKFLMRRARAYWQMLATLSLGVILATAFLASGPLLIDTAIQFGLRRTLLNGTESSNSLTLTGRKAPNSDQYAALDEEIQRFLQERFPNQLTEVVPFARVGLLYPWQERRIITNRRIAVWFYGASQEELSEHVELVAGSWVTGDRPEPDVIGVMVGQPFADAFDLAVGERLPVSLSLREEAAGLWLEVAGIIASKDLQDPYLSGELNPLRPYRANAEAVNYAIIAMPDQFFSLANEHFPDLSVEFGWQTNVAADKLLFEDIGEWQTSLDSLELELLQIDEDMRLQTSLGELLATFSAQANVVRAPLYFLIGIVVMVALYYLVMVAALSLERMEREIAVLRSRGASGRWLSQLQFLEAAAISITAILSGPLLARSLVKGLATYGPLAGIADENWALSLSQAAWLAAIVAAVACIGSLMLPLPSLLKRTVITHHQNIARAGRPLWWQRAYLDLFLLVVGLILILRLQLVGNIVGDAAETGQVDLLLLISPLILLLGAAAILLRVFPVLLRGGARLVSRGKGLPAVLAFWQAARQPRHITRLVLLLMLAMALGFLSSSLNAALDLNERERTHYSVGSDVRVMLGAGNGEGDAFTEAGDLAGSAAGARATAVAWRAKASLDFGTTFPALDLLAINPDSFNDVAQYRSDFSRLPLAQLTARMEEEWETSQNPVPGRPLPGKPAHIGIWYSLPFSLREDPDQIELLNSLTIEARVQSSEGEMISTPLIFDQAAGESDGDWHYFEGDLPELNQSSYPIYLQTLWVRNRLITLERRDGIWFDDVTIVDGQTNVSRIIDDFDYLDEIDDFTHIDDQHFFPWHPVTTLVRASYVGIRPRSGSTGLGLTFGMADMSRVRWYGISQVQDMTLQPIPALVSPAFIARTELQSGDLVRLSVRVAGANDLDEVTFKILDSVAFFPTMYETEEAGFIVTLRQPLLDQINLDRYTPIQGNELFVATATSEEEDALSTTLNLSEQQILSADSMLETVKAHPLALGLRSVTLFGYLLTTVLTVVGFGSHFYLVTRQRVTEYGILRALGLSPRQLYGTLMLEQLLLILSGLTLGTILGILLVELILTGLPLQMGEGAAVPPFLNQIDWIAAARIYLTLTVAFFLSLGMASLFLWRQRIHRVLRVGEE